MNSNRKIIVLSVLVVLIAIVSGVSVTYAYWAKNIISENPNIVRSGCLNIEFSDLSSPISFDRTYPGEEVSYSENLNRHDDYYFKVTNMCNTTLGYSVNLETLNGSTLDASYLSVLFRGMVDQNNEISSLDDFLNVVDNISDYSNSNKYSYADTTLGYLESTATTLDNAIYANKLSYNFLGAHQSYYYSLKTNVSRYFGDNENTIDKSWYGKVTINSYYDPNTVPTSDSILKENAFSESFGGDNIVAIRPYDGTPSHEILTSATVLSMPGSESTYAWVDGTTLYYYSKATKIYMLSERFGAIGDDWAANFSNVEYLDLSRIDTSKMTDMKYLFFKLTKLEYLDISSFDTTNVTNMVGMFKYCSSLKSLDLSFFNTSNVTTMSSMFSFCYDLTSLNISNFNTSNVVDMSSMFFNCHSLTDLDLSFFNTSNVTTMSGMFSCCYDLTSLNISNFNTSNVVYMSSMFSSCNSLTNLDLSSFETGKVNFGDSYCFGCGIFNSTSNLTSITIDCEKSPSLKDYIENRTGKTIVCSNKY